MTRRGITTGAAAVAIGLGLAACGGGASDTAGETSGQFPVTVRASFPQQQRLAQNSDLVVTVTNSGSKPLPDVAVTITNPREGTAAQALGTLLAAPQPGQPVLSGRSRPVWVLNQAPGPCKYSCSVGGPGGAATAFSNTWALGRLKPGQTARFDWKVTAVRPGSFAVKYEVAAGLSSAAHAVGDTIGTFNVNISTAPQQQYVNNAGQVVNQN